VLEVLDALGALAVPEVLAAALLGAGMEPRLEAVTVLEGVEPLVVLDPVGMTEIVVVVGAGVAPVGMLTGLSMMMMSGQEEDHVLGMNVERTQEGM
jgi:hypothetical protein